MYPPDGDDVTVTQLSNADSLKGVGTAPPEELTGDVNGFGWANTRYLLRNMFRSWEITHTRSQTRFYTS